MSTQSTSQLDAALDAAHRRSVSWLTDSPQRPIPAAVGIDAVAAALGGDLPREGMPTTDVVEMLADAVEPGLMVSQSPRFYGWVMGGTYPVAIAADWLTTAWDQNAGMREVTTGVVGAEETAGRWTAQLLGLPRESAVGFTTGATAANFVCLAAARTAVLARVGWDDAAQGLAGGPRVRVVAGVERHGSIDLAARYVGLGTPELVAVDAQGRVVPEDLERVLGAGEGPVIVALQAGNIHSGAFDPFEECVRIAHRHGAWVHIDGAFGLWAAASGSFRRLMAGAADADSWATDAHKTLNVPYDCGVAIVRDDSPVRAAMGVHASYLTESATAADPYELVPEMSRRARGVPVWAVLRHLGSSGVDELVTRLAASAGALADRLSQLPGVTVLNDVVFTQVCIALADDARTRALGDALRSDGTAFASSSRWHDREVLRFSVSNHGTDDAAVDQTVAAVASALDRMGAGVR